MDDDDATPPDIEGDEPGECDDGADNDADTLYDCDDPDCAGAPACEEELNTPPTAPVVSIVPANPHSTEPLNCFIEAPSEDADDHLVTYAWSWTVNGDDSGVTDLVVPASETSTGDTLVCTVTPNDGFVDGPAGSATVTVTNDPPTAPGVTILPGVPITTDDLTCIIETPSEDPEGFAVSYSYAWTRDGIDAGITGPSVAADETSGNEAWECSVTANDGGDDGPPGTAAVTIDIPIACLDGSEEISPAYWYRDDIAYCASPGGTSLSSAECAEGWHICTADEFEDRNDAFNRSVLTFNATGGGRTVINSVVVESSYNAASDLVDDDTPGACPGTLGNPNVEDVGRRGGGFGWVWCSNNSCGSLCCYQ